MVATSRVPPHLYFVVGAVFHYTGPAFAVLLFVQLDPLGVVWLRIASAALVLALWRRPWRVWPRLARQTRRTLVLWGAVLAIMNACFYLSIGALPLGTVAAIEFVPVVALAALGVRSWRNGSAVVLAAAGAYLLIELQLSGQPVGVLLAAANAVLFAAYVLVGHHVSRIEGLSGIDALALSMLIATVLSSPLCLWSAVPAFTDPRLLAAAVGIGICSSVVPYVADQLAMRQVDRATYALMVSLLPATATVVGILVLTQLPTPTEVVGVLLVIAGITVHAEAVRPTSPAPVSRAEA